jgi:hypothetical protein
MLTYNRRTEYGAPRSVNTKYPNRLKNRKNRRPDRFRPYSYSRDPYYQDLHGKFDYDNHIWLQKPLKHKFPNLSYLFSEAADLAGYHPYNVYLDVGLTGIMDFRVFAGKPDVLAARFDMFFNRYGVWNPEDQILHLHMGQLVNCPDVYDEYCTRTLSNYLKFHSPLLVQSEGRFYSVRDFYHQYYEPRTHVIHCYTDEVEECLLPQMWKTKNLSPEPRLDPELEVSFNRNTIYKADWIDRCQPSEEVRLLLEIRNE